MFHLPPDARLTKWSDFRKQLNYSNQPFDELNDFWKSAPRITYNNKLDPFNPQSWPTPWEIIYENKYDDFTLAVMMAYTIKLTDKFAKDLVEVRSFVDQTQKHLYNLVFINEEIVLNYIPEGYIKAQDIENTLYLENIIEIIFPR